MEFLPSLIFCLSVSTFLHFSDATIPSGTIERASKQQILATIPPNSGADNSIPFLTSPSGKYTAYFLRTQTAPGAGGFGNDFCYVQIQESSGGQSLWESECAPVSEANSCTLVFDNAGLEVFDGSNIVWGTAAASTDDNPLQTVELVDQGDMWIRDKIGELAWRASDNPRANQGCGLPGSPGLAPALPPFAQPIGGKNLPFGQQPQTQTIPGGGSSFNQQQQEGGVAGVTQNFGFDNQQPLLDNTPFDSGCFRRLQSWLAMEWVLVAGILAHYVLL